MSVFKWGLPILNLAFRKARVGKRAQKIFEKLVGENQAAGLSKHSAYNAAKQELIKKYKLKTDLKGNVLNRAEGGEVQKLLAGGLLNPLIKTALKTKGYKSFSKTVNKYAKDLVKQHKKDPAIAKLEAKRLKIDAIKTGLDKSRKEMSKNLYVRKHYFGASSQAREYQKKLKDIIKAYMHKKANPKIQTHSEGGEIVFGKNVDKDLL
jgi:hypothetical protein